MDGYVTGGYLRVSGQIFSGVGGFLLIIRAVWHVAGEMVYRFCGGYHSRARLSNDPPQGGVSLVGEEGCVPAPLVDESSER